MFEMTFWRAIFLIGLVIILILKYRNGLDIIKTLPAGVIAAIISILINLALVKMGLISYNLNKLGSPIMGLSLFHQLSSGLVGMMLIHFSPKDGKNILLYLTSFTIIVSFIVYIALQLDVINFLQWDYIRNFILDFISLGVVYYSYQFIKEKYLV